MPHPTTPKGTPSSVSTYVWIKVSPCFEPGLKTGARIICESITGHNYIDPPCPDCHPISFAFNQSFIAVAPVILVVCAVPEESAERYQERGRSLYAIQDTAALTLNLLLGAHLHGYGACWIGAFSEKAVAHVLNIPSFMRPVSMVPVGSVDGSLPPMRPRKNASDVVVSNKFN